MVDFMSFSGMNIPDSSTRRYSNCRDDRGANNSNEGQEVCEEAHSEKIEQGGRICL
jgi:hypothetical protein